MGVVKALTEFEHIIFSLKPVNDFCEELEGVKVIFYDFRGIQSLPTTSLSIRKLILKYNVDVVHAHLYWSSIVSRFATPSNIKLFNSYHNILYSRIGANYPLHSRLLDKLTYTSRVNIFCVSSEVKRDVMRYIGATQNVTVLYNYIEDVFFDRYREYNDNFKKLKFVAVGNLKSQKNYEVIIRAFALFNEKFGSETIILDVFGKGELLHHLIKLSEELKVDNVRFVGAVSNVSDHLPNYNGYILSSTHEGFGIAVAEAMAVGLPLILSDIPVLQEVTSGNAYFFNPADQNSLLKVLSSINSDKSKLKGMSVLGREISQAFRKDLYMKTLSGYYS